MPHVFGLVAFLLPLLGQQSDKSDVLLTVAERSGYRATAHYDDVAAWCREFARTTPNAVLTELGRSAEGRAIPLLIVADPPVKTAAQAASSGKLVCLIIGNIHAGEVCGKEGLPILLREEFSGAHPPLLKDLILAVAPIYNTDGNERFAKTNRPGQVGPEEGMGQRANARGLDLNRDFIKLEAPETRGLVGFLNDWNPHLFIDTHTTNGSHHRYTVTYQGPLSPTGDSKVLDFMRQTYFPQVTAAFKKRTGLDSFYYGNFNRDKTQWTTVPAEGRYGTTYVGMRNRLSVLSEAYSYAPYKTRVLATRDFVRDCLEVASSHKADILKMLNRAGSAPARGPQNGPASAGDSVAIRSKVKAAATPATVLGFVEREENGRRVRTDTPKDYALALMNEFEPAETVGRPFAYLIPASCGEVVANLQRHGVEVQELREDIELDVEVYKVDAIERSPRRFEGHNTEVLRVSPRQESRMVHAGTWMVRPTGRLGNLAVSLLEPRSEDGLATWNFFDAQMKAGGDFPVFRLPRSAPFSTSPAENLAAARRSSGRSRLKAAVAAAGAGAAFLEARELRAGLTRRAGCKCATAGSPRWRPLPAG